MTGKIPDRRAMEKTTSDLSRLLEGKDFDSEEEVNEYLKKMVKNGYVPKTLPKNAFAVAQDLVYDAWETEDREERIKLAHKALSLSPNCADAYVLLAEETAKTFEEKKSFIKKVFLQENGRWVKKPLNEIKDIFGV